MRHAALSEELQQQFIVQYEQGLSMMEVAKLFNVSVTSVHKYLHKANVNTTRKLKPAEIRFWKHVNKTTECWLWTGAVDSAGYGRFNVGEGQLEGSHRFSYTLHKGTIPQDYLVCHTCDTKLCVNPEHLWLGTYKDNNNDMIAKGRGFWQIGEKN